MAGTLRGDGLHVLRRPELAGTADTHVGAHDRPHHEQRTSHVAPRIAHVGVGERVIGPVARLMHGEEVGQHLGGMPLVCETVVDGYASVRGQVLHVAVGRAPKLDRVVHATEHPGRVGDRLLVSEL